jgi:PhoPQ-activated pathogenicity-related protein
VVIDTLNMQKQMDHQLASFGAYSRMIKDYTERKLVPLPPGDDAKKLWEMVDPYCYRDKYTMPKLILNGTNDPYWTQDALNFYWDALPAKKWVAYVPNAGHDVQQVLPDGKKSSERAACVLAGFAHCQIHGKAMPAISWKFEDVKDGCRLILDAESAQGARLWVADSKTRDFRESKWSESPAKLKDGRASVTVAAPGEGFRVVMAEADFEVDGLPFRLTTQVRILGK